MQLSEQTVTILRNFSQINNSIHIDEEGFLKTKSANSSSIIAIAEIQEKFPDMSIYSLNEFIGAMSLLNQEKISFKFTKEYIMMNDDKVKINYRLSDPSHILSKCKAAENYKAFNDFNGSFEMNLDTLSTIQKAARVLNADTLIITMKNDKGTITLQNSDMPLNNSFEIEIDGTGSGQISVSIDNLLVVNSDYVIEFSNDKVMKLTNKNYPMFYLIAATL